LQSSLVAMGDGLAAALGSVRFALSPDGSDFWN